MMHCGRCGKEIGHEISDMFQPFRVIERQKDENGQTFACSTVFCGDCRAELKNWLKAGGYDRQKKTWLPCIKIQQGGEECRTWRMEACGSVEGKKT